MILRNTSESSIRCRNRSLQQSVIVSEEGKIAWVGGVDQEPKVADARVIEGGGGSRRRVSRTCVPPPPPMDGCSTLPPA